MNLLFLLPQLPYPPRQGTAIRNWGLIKHLAARHTITVLSFMEAGQTVAPELQAVCARVLTVPVPIRSRADRIRTLFSAHADLARRLWSPEFASALAALLREAAFDVIHIEGLEMAPYLSVSGQRSAVSLYDAHNAEYVIQQRALLTDLRQPARWPAALYSALQVPRLRALEANVCRRVSAVTCVSAADAAALQTLVPALRPVIIANGIDVEEYSAVSGQPSAVSHQPSAISGQRSAISRLPSSVLRLVFTGKMDYRPNLDAALWFAREILPRIRQAKPEAEFVVVGQKPPESLRTLDGRAGVIVTGAVEETRPLIAEAAVYVAPLRMGGGTRFKLLEAMALARPIVSTRVGAEGFEVQNGRELLLADSPADFAEAVVSVLNDPVRAETLGQAGLAFVRAGYDWSAIIPRLEQLYSEANP